MSTLSYLQMMLMLSFVSEVEVHLKNPHFTI